MCTEWKVTVLELFLNKLCGLGKSCRGKRNRYEGKREQKVDNLLSDLHNQKSDFAFVYFLDVLVYFYVLEL